MPLLAYISYPPIPIFEVGPLRLSLHGVAAALGFLAGAWIATREVRRRGYDEMAFNSVLTWALFGALLGARFFTIPAHLGDPGFGLDDALSPAGSYSILGGMAGGILAGAWRIRRLGLSFWPLADAAAPGLALGTVVGRLGDLAIVEHLGGPTDFFLGFAVRPGYDLAPQHDVLECVGDPDVICGVYHFSAFYDLLGAAVLLGVLLYLRRRWTDRRYGQLFAFWVAWYGFQRFLIDFTRLGLPANRDATLGPLTWSQWSGLAIGLLGIAMLTWLRRHQPVVSVEEDIARGAVPPASGVSADEEETPLPPHAPSM